MKLPSFWYGGDEWANRKNCTFVSWKYQRAFPAAILRSLHFFHSRFFIFHGLIVAYMRRFAAILLQALLIFLLHREKFWARERIYVRLHWVNAGKQANLSVTWIIFCEWARVGLKCDNINNIINEFRNTGKWKKRKNRLHTSGINYDKQEFCAMREPFDYTFLYLKIKSIMSVDWICR